jgi:hypothetical protein
MVESWDFLIQDFLSQYPFISFKMSEFSSPRKNKCHTTHLQKTMQHINDKSIKCCVLPKKKETRKTAKNTNLTFAKI